MDEIKVCEVCGNHCSEPYNHVAGPLCCNCVAKERGVGPRCDLCQDAVAFAGLKEAR